MDLNVWANCRYREIKKVLNSVKESAVLFQETTGCENYANPFRVDDFSTPVAELRKRLIEKLVQYWRETLCPGVSIDEYAEFHKTMNEQCGDSGFDAFLVARMVKERYADNQRQVAWQQIKEKARELLPYCSQEGQWGPAQNPKDIQKGDKITLRAFLCSTGYGNHLYLDTYKHTEAFCALERLIDVTLNGTAPEGTGAGILSRVLRNAKGKEFFGVAHDLGNGVKSIRCFQNGKVALRFKSEEDAHKVASELVA